MALCKISAPSIKNSPPSTVTCELPYVRMHGLEGRANLADDPENKAPYELILLRGLHLMLMASHTDTVVSSLKLAPESNGLHCLVHHYFALGLLLQMLEVARKVKKRLVGCCWEDLRIH